MSALWFPVSFLILIFSFVYLLQIPEHKQNLSLSVPEVLAQYNSNNNMDNNRVVPSLPLSDIRITALRNFLKVYNSPLYEHVESLVKTADLWGLDYALIPAIAMQESGGCKVIPEDSYNCWGYGIYGDKVTRFTSYEEAMIQVAKTIKETYIKNGLTNPTLLEDRWTPSSRGSWSYSVNYFIGKIKELEKSAAAS